MSHPVCSCRLAPPTSSFWPLPPHLLGSSHRARLAPPPSEPLQPPVSQMDAGDSRSLNAASCLCLRALSNRCSGAGLDRLFIIAILICRRLAREKRSMRILENSVEINCPVGVSDQIRVSDVPKKRGVKVFRLMRPDS